MEVAQTLANCAMKLREKNAQGRKTSSALRWWTIPTNPDIFKADRVMYCSELSARLGPPGIWTLPDAAESCSDAVHLLTENDVNYD